MRPANGSASVLKTKIETGSLVAILRSIVSPFLSGCLWPDGDLADIRRRQNLRDEVQDRVAADIVQRRTQQYGKDALCLHGFAQALFQIFHRQRALVEEFLHQRVVALSDHFDQLLVRRFRFFGALGGNFVCLCLAVAIGRVR